MNLFTLYLLWGTITVAAKEKTIAQAIKAEQEKRKEAQLPGLGVGTRIILVLLQIPTWVFISKLIKNK